MRRFLVGLLLTFGIIIVVGFGLGRYLANGDEANFFNTNVRATLAQYKLTRNFFALHETGDARSDYLGSRYLKILIEVDSFSGQAPAPAVMYDLAERIKSTTGKPTTVIFSDEDIPNRDITAIGDIDQIIDTHRTSYSGADTAVVYLLIIDRFPDEPTSLGSTHDADQIILSTQALQDFTADHVATYDNYLLSTALHEFGHLVGLSHNDQEGCLMNTHAEADHIPKFNVQDVITNFCAFEQAQLLQLK